jgi:methionine sulfoxide reductase heme-binding subunit
MTEIPWAWLAIRGSGITAWGLLTAVVVWGIVLRTQLLGSVSPLRLLTSHRWLGIVAMAFLALHMALLLVDPAVQFTVAQLLVPGLAPWEAFAVGLGTVAFWLMLAVSVVGRLRSRMGRAGNRMFRRAHLLAYAAWPLATMHYVLAGTDALADWSLALLFAGTGLVVTALLARGFVPAPGPVVPAERHDRTDRSALTRA